MARLLGYFSNQADRIRCALALESDATTIDPAVRVDGWGVGSYQSGEVLLRKRPAEQREQVSFQELVRDLRTDCALVHVRSATVGSRSLENTHPFRYRHWLFAHNGSVPGFDTLRPALVARLPDFLARALRGETDSEVLFNLFLSFVYEMGRLDDPELDRRSVGSAMREAVRALDALSDQHGLPRATFNAVVTNHASFVALRRGLPMSWIRRQGIRDCAVCRKQPETAGREPKRVDHEAFKYVMVASDHGSTPPGWFDLPNSSEGAILAVDRGLDAQVTELR